MSSPVPVFSSAEPYPTTPDPGDYFIAPPDRPPDFYLTEEDDSQQDWHNFEEPADPTTCLIWAPDGDQPCLVMINHVIDAGRMLRNNYTSNLYQAITELHKLGEEGLRPILEHVGIFTSVEVDPNDPDASHVQVVVPSVENFCRAIDQLSDAGILHIRFEPTQQPGSIKGWDQLRTMAENGRVLLARPDMSEPDSEERLKHIDFFLHDLLDHAPAYFGLTAQTAEILFGRARAAHQAAEEYRRIHGEDPPKESATWRLMSSFIIDIDDSLATYQLLHTLARRANTFLRFCRSPEIKVTGQEQVRQHVNRALGELAERGSN